MVTIAAIDLKYDQDGRYTHLWLKKKINKSLCPVTILVDSQVSDRCPLATCIFLQIFILSPGYRPCNFYKATFLAKCFFECVSGGE